MYNKIIQDHIFIVLITLSHLLHEKKCTQEIPLFNSHYLIKCISPLMEVTYRSSWRYVTVFNKVSSTLRHHRAEWVINRRTNYSSPIGYWDTTTHSRTNYIYNYILWLANIICCLPINVCLHMTTDVFCLY